MKKLDIDILNTTQIENIDNKELNQLLLENLFPLENKQIRYFTSNYYDKLNNNKPSESNKGKIGIINL